MKTLTLDVGTCPTCLRPNCPTPRVKETHPEQGCSNWTRKPMLTTSEQTVVAKFQADRIERIKAYHAGCLKSFADQMGYAYLAGAELVSLKDETPHGQFEKVKEEQFTEIPRSSLGRYMQFAEAIQAKYPTVGYLRPTKLLTNGTFDEKEQGKVLKAVHDVADGKTLTQLYRDLGVIRQKEPKQYHPPKPVKPEDAEAAAKSQADEAAKRGLADTELLMQNDTWSLLSTARQQEVEDLRLTLGSFIKQHSPKSKKK